VAAGDEKPPEESDEESPAAKRPDVRVGSHDDMGVHISRDLRATGPTARGFGSNMSKLSFSSRGIPHGDVVDDAAPAPTKPATVDPPPSPAAPESDGALSWLTGLFSRR
jgi:hypothetical protein